LGDPPDSPETLTSTQFAAILALSTEENRFIVIAIQMVDFSVKFFDTWRDAGRDLHCHGALQQPTPFG
jgi:hypothetical protein